MAIDLTSPSVGLDRETGSIITGWEHVQQSLQDIFATYFGERIIREWYGSFVPQLLGRLITPNEVTPYFAAICSAIETWEPRYRITLVLPLKVTREGELQLRMEGEYRPRATLGDFTVEGVKRIDGFITSQGVILRETTE